MTGGISTCTMTRFFLEYLNRIQESSGEIYFMILIFFFFVFERELLLSWPEGLQASHRKVPREINRFCINTCETLRKRSTREMGQNKTLDFDAFFKATCRFFIEK